MSWTIDPATAASFMFHGHIDKTKNFQVAMLFEADPHAGPNKFYLNPHNLTKDFDLSITFFEDEQEVVSSGDVTFDKVICYPFQLGRTRRLIGGKEIGKEELIQQMVDLLSQS